MTTETLNSEATTSTAKSLNWRELLQSPGFLKGLAISLGIILVVGGLAAGISTIQKSKDAELQEVYYGFESQALKVIETFEKDKKTFSLGDFGNTVSELQTFVQAHDSTLAGQMGALLLADIYAKSGQKDQSLEVLKAVKPVGEIGVLAQYRSLSLMSDKAQYQEVVTLADSLLKKGSAKVLYPEIRLAKALALAELNQREAAISELQVIVDSKLTEGSQIQTRAKKYIRLLKVEAI